MKVHIYLLFLSIWTINCLDINHINGSSTARTTVGKTTDPTESKMDDFRKRLLGFIVGIMIITFTFTCFCLLHYNCMIKEVPPPGGLNKENMAAISSWVSKVSACQPDIITEDMLETQPLLLNSDHISGPSSQENLSMPNNTIKLDEPSSLEKPCIPSNPQNSKRCTKTDKSSMPYSVKKSKREFNPKRSTKSSHPQRLHTSSSLNKPYKKHSLKKSHKLARTCKLTSRVNSSSSKMQIIPPWLTIVQTSAALTTQPCPSVSNNQLVSTKPSRRRPNQAHERHDLKKSVSTGKAGLPRKHSSFTFCQHCQEKCLICNPEFLLNDLVEPRREHAGNRYVSSTMKPYPKSFHVAKCKYTESGYKYNCYQDNETDETTKTYESEDSSTEIVIICDKSHEDDDMAETISTY